MAGYVTSSEKPARSASSLTATGPSSIFSASASNRRRSSNESSDCSAHMAIRCQATRSIRRSRVASTSTSGSGEVVGVIISASGGRVYRRGLHDLVDDGPGVRDRDRVRRAGDLERALCVGALRHVLLKGGGDDVVVLADQEA